MNRKNILVTGASGMLGSTFVAMVEKLYRISTFPAGVDVANTQDVAAQLKEIKPDIILHTAAYTDVDGCELDPDKAHRVNVLGTKNLVIYCKKHNKELVYISSTGVYGNRKQIGYTEDDDTDPTTVHHLTKLKAERFVQESLTKHLILRVGWLYGGGIDHKNNFVYKRFLEGKNKKVIYSDVTQKGNPTNCEDVVNQIFLLLEKNQYGVFNCVNEALNVSRFDYVKDIISSFGLDCRVEIASDDMFGRIAPVSNNESAINKRLEDLGLNIMPNWKQSLVKYIDELKS